MTAEHAAEVVSTVVKVVSNLDEEDEQSTENIGIIANIYDDINNLVVDGKINVTESVSIAMSVALT